VRPPFQIVLVSRFVGYVELMQAALLVIQLQKADRQSTVLILLNPQAGSTRVQPPNTFFSRSVVRAPGLWRIDCS
jgi:hypothetical protein